MAYTETVDLDGDIMRASAYGMEIVLDCFQCDPSKFNRTDIREYMNGLVKLLKMKKGPLHFWDDWRVPKKYQQTDPNTKGTSAVQFILTSNITIHCLDLLENVYVNIFSCKDFDEGKAHQYTQTFFKAKMVRAHRLVRM